MTAEGRATGSGRTSEEPGDGTRSRQNVRRLFREEALREYAEPDSGAEELELADRRFVWILWLAAVVLIVLGAVLIWPLIARFAG